MNKSPNEWAKCKVLRLSTGITFLTWFIIKRAWEILISIWSKWFFQFRGLIVEFCSYLVPFMATSFPEKSHFLLLVLNTVYFASVGFKDRSLAQNQSNNSANLELAWLNSSSRSESETYNDVSSTKDIIWPLVNFEISFTYIKYKSGSKIDPCGTPHIMFWKPDLVISISTYCLQSVFYENVMINYTKRFR